MGNDSEGAQESFGDGGRLSLKYGELTTKKWRAKHISSYTTPGVVTE